MGMFDTVKLKCPNCAATVEEQTKSGPCTLKTYTLKSAPIEIMVGVLGDVLCYHCMVPFKVEMVQPPKFAIRKLTEEELLDRDVNLEVMGGE